MAEFPMFPLWTDAYLGDTSHLSMAEHGAYLLLLIAMWRSPSKSLPNDDVKLARFARANPQQWARVKPTVMEFFDVDGDQISQGRLRDEASAVQDLKKRQSKRAMARWLKTKETGNAAAMPDECRGNASPTLPTPIRRTLTPTVAPDSKPLRQRSEESPRKKGSRLPADWSLPEPWKSEAVRLGLSEAAAQFEAAKFADYWHAKAGKDATKIDWLATWRNWCRTTLTRVNGRHHPDPPPKRKPTPEERAAHDAWWEAKEAADREKLAERDRRYAEAQRGDDDGLLH